MRSGAQLGRWGALLVFGLAACEVLIMISPFAGFFYASVHFEPLLGFLSNNAATAWLDGFFLNHSVVTHSALLEWQREIGLFIFALGMWGFLISAFQVYGNKITGRGVARGFLYRISRHPQYLSLALAGWGLLTIWPRFLLLGGWITMLFLYAGLARFEEQLMEQRFGDAYRDFAKTRGAFLPGSPIRRLFEASFDRLRPRAVGWVAAYAFSLAVAFSLGFALRGYTRSQTAMLIQPKLQTVVISAWPQPEDWIEKVIDVARSQEEVKQQLEKQGNDPLVVTVLNPDYVMRGMFYKMANTEEEDEPTTMGSALLRVGRIAWSFMIPTSGWVWGDGIMGVDPDESDKPVEVVFSRAVKPFKEVLSFDEVLDASVRLTPLIVVDVEPTTGEVPRVRVPLPQNRWGPRVVMPLL
jgi:protein-S-isoprenylcysteine O-methyltransferase Ste14